VKVFIYGLIDPRTKEVRYVGKTEDLDKRLLRHIRENVDAPKTHKECWIRQLRNNGLVPEMKILATANKRTWIKIEKEYITRFNKRGRLTNLTKGGENPPVHRGPRSVDWNLAISKALKGHSVSQITRDKLSVNGKKNPVNFWKGKKFSKLHSSRISKAKKGIPMKEETKLKISKPVVQLTRKEEFIREWSSAVAAGRGLSISKGNINSCLKGKRKTAGNYIWKYKG